MRNLILIFIIVLAFLQVNAQKWALPSSTWITSFSQTSPVYYGTIKVKGDTIINNISCKIIGNQFSNYLYTYESNDTVYFYLAGKFRPTYYFNVQVNDTISFFDINFCNQDSIIIAKIDKIDSINAGNKYLKRFNFTITNRDTTQLYNLSNSYIEYIGSNYLYPFLYCRDMIDQESLAICDYGDSTIQNYFVNNNNCVSVSVQDKVNEEIYFSIFPNPTQNQLTISATVLETVDGFSISFYDLLGKEIYQKTFPQGQILEQVNVSQWARGLYSYKVTSEGEILKTGKVIVEH